MSDKSRQTNLTSWRKKYNIPTNKFLIQKTLQYITSKNWYTNSNKAIKDKFGDNTDLFINILASTSQRNSVGFNVKVATKTLIYHKNNIPIKFKFGIASKQIEKNIDRCFNNEPLGGQKINAFAKALKGDLNSIVIDTWIMHVFNLRRKSPTSCDIRQIKTIINKISKEIELRPAEIQACLWSYAKLELNDSAFKEDNDFSYYLKNMHPDRYIEEM